MQSRYYNPEWGRFINADESMGKVGDLLSHNMFSYCDNNPVNREDQDGHFWNFIIGAAIGFATTYIGDVIMNTIDNGGFDLSCLKFRSSAGEYVGSMVIGALSGGLGGSIGAKVVQTGAKLLTKVGGELAFNAAGSLARQGVDAMIGREKVSVEATISDAIIGTAATGVSKTFGLFAPEKNISSRQVMRNVERSTGKSIAVQRGLVRTYNEFMKNSFEGTGSIFWNVGSKLVHP